MKSFFGLMLEMHLINSERNLYKFCLALLFNAARWCRFIVELHYGLIYAIFSPILTLFPISSQWPQWQFNGLHRKKTLVKSRRTFPFNCCTFLSEQRARLRKLVGKEKVQFWGSVLSEAGEGPVLIPGWSFASVFPQ